MTDRPRWERDAERVRNAAPPWMDIERVPWWIVVVIGLVLMGNGIRLVIGDGSSLDRVNGVVHLVLAPTLVLAARRRRRGQPSGASDGGE